MSDNGKPIALAEPTKLPVKRNKPFVARRRPKDFTPEVRQKILNALKLANFPDTASLFAGVRWETVKGWYERGVTAGPTSRGVEREFYDFSVAFDNAMAEAEVYMLNLVRRAGEPDPKTGRIDWSAIAWILERTRPRKFGKQVAHTGPAGGPVEVRHRVDLSALSDEELDTLISLRRKADWDSRRQRELGDGTVIDIEPIT
jgi:hypothetical protein